jgi:glycosyltransferase involved in cell wall biosynthesis
LVINKSLIIPLKEESEEVIEILSNFIDYLKDDTELIVVLDSEQDPTYKFLKNSNLNIQILISTLGPGASNAINYGINNSKGKHVCIAMGDGSDDPRQVEDLLLLVQRGLSVAVASRYSRGGQFVGNKNFKYLLSKYSGFFLNLFFRIGTKDPSNMFKAYDKSFINMAQIESDVGFTLGLEMVIKAKLYKKNVGEIPTIWIDRKFGESKFKFQSFLPKYLYWVSRLLLRKK